MLDVLVNRCDGLLAVLVSPSPKSQSRASPVGLEASVRVICVLPHPVVSDRVKSATGSCMVVNLCIKVSFLQP